MSAVDELREKKKGKKRAGSGRLGSALRGTQATKPRWKDCEDEAALALIDTLVEAGGAVLFGASRDGMVLSLTLHLDGDREVVWLDRDKDVTGQVDAIRDRLRETLL